MRMWWWIAGAYFVGAIPSAYIITRLVTGKDVREHGSKNPGATNCFRVAGPLAGISALIIDILKGYVPVYVALYYSGDPWLYTALAVGVAALAGHTFTPFLGFKGGKGVATGTGVFGALLPVPTAIAVASFIIVFAFSRYVSLGSITAALVLPLAAFLRHDPPLLNGTAALIGMLVIVRHNANIQRLITGTELKVMLRQKKKDENTETGKDKV